MSSLPKAAGLAFGALSLFFLSFVTFTALSGAPMHEVAVIGSLFEPPPDEKSEKAEVADFGPPADPVDNKTQGEILEASANVLGSFVLPSPFSSTELQELSSELKAKKIDYEHRLRKLHERESVLEERETLVEERYAELSTLRSALQEFEAELSLRSEEVSRDEKARIEREKVSWATVARLFEKGDAEDLIAKLLTYSPEEAAKIFSSLSVDRVRALTEALPVDRYQEYVNAFRMMQSETVSQTSQ